MQERDGMGGEAWLKPSPSFPQRNSGSHGCTEEP